MDTTNERDQIIKNYFNLGLAQAEISALLFTKHDIKLSSRQLKRILKKLGLSRRTNYSPIEEIKDFIKNELSYSGQLHGYRWMHLKCIQNGFIVKQKNIRLLLKELDPRGVDFRTRKRLRRRVYSNKGPNYLWHLDAYDKLKPYGICIHGCIDGFSRHLMWLKASTNTNDPRIIAGYFIKRVESIGGCPIRIRADCGTENRFVEQMQIFLREKEDSPPESAWLYGTSQSNQRIEAWWSILRKHGSQFWINLFHQLKDDGLFSGSFIDKCLIQFCFLKMIQAELDTIAVEWNSHRITNTRNAIAPAGRPVILYNAPEIYNTKDYLREVDQGRLASCKEECVFGADVCDDDVSELCNIVMEEKGMQIPGDPYEGVTLYTELRVLMHNLLQDRNTT